MRECKYNIGIDATACKGCNEHCGFNQSEITRKKNRINKGAGLTVNANGLKQLKVKKG